MKNRGFCLSTLLIAGLMCTRVSILYAGVLSIPASALLPKDNNISYDSNGVRMAVPDVGDRAFLAPVFLPNGAKVTMIVLEARDFSGGEFGGHVKIEVVRTRYNTVLPLVELDTGIVGAPGEARISKPVQFTVDNAEYGYGVSVVINNGSGGAWNQLFYKVIIHYTMDCLADFNFDGDVDGTDLTVFSSEFGRTNCN